MDWIAVFIIYMNFITLQAKYDTSLRSLVDLIKRRRSVVRVPVYPEHLPGAEPILPGHTLIRPALGMLKSAIKFPLRDTGNSLVYGNADNIGIRYGNTNDRVLYTGFRKANNLLATIQDIIRASNKKKKNPSLIILELNPSNLQQSKPSLPEEIVPEEDNDGREALDESSIEDSYDVDYRRKRKSKYRHRSSQHDTSSTSSSSEYEANPGNPYTIFKNKYKQNWMWNHVMDGNHMNINPYGPEFKQFGPPGKDLFFGRKWWYFNEDDYKPM